MPAWFDEFADAVAAGTQEYLVCEPCGEALLPPRPICPACGSDDLNPEPLPDRGLIQSFTEISVTIPKFHGATPYTVVLVEFEGGARLTGQLREATAEEVDIGDEVSLGVERSEGEVPVLTFRPRPVEPPTR